MPTPQSPLAAPPSTPDVLIVGGGPAGLTASMYLARASLHAVVLERGECGGELLNTEHVENFISYESVLGRDLAARMAAHARAAGADVREFTPVAGLQRNEAGVFVAELESGESLAAPVAILTAGGTPRRLGIPGEAEYAGRGVSYCAVCDANFFRGHDILVVGGSDSACEEADYLTRFASTVTMVHRRDRFRASQVLQDRVFANPKIRVVWNAAPEEVVGAEGLMTGLRVRDVTTGASQTIPGTGCFIFIGFTPNTGVLREHCAHDAGGYLMTDAAMMTSVPGLFAAGDVRSQLARQVTTACGDGTTAGLAAARLVTSLRNGMLLTDAIRELQHSFG